MQIPHTRQPGTERHSAYWMASSLTRISCREDFFSSNNSQFDPQSGSFACFWPYVFPASGSVSDEWRVEKTRTEVCRLCLWSVVRSPVLKTSSFHSRGQADGLLTTVCSDFRDCVIWIPLSCQHTNKECICSYAGDTRLLSNNPGPLENSDLTELEVCSALYAIVAFWCIL